MTNSPSRRGFLGLLGVTAGSIAGCVQAPDTETEQVTTTTAAQTEQRPQQIDVDQATPADGVDPGLSDPTASSARYTDVYRQVETSVAQIQVIGSGGTQSSGTGFVYDDRGHLVTNEHVVADATRVFVRFPTAGWQRASVVGTDVYSDLAVIQIDQVPDEATPLAMVARDPPIGQEVIAIGTPFGLSGSVTAGIVSGVDRTLSAPNGFSIPDAIQTDAPVNPGNSGGPLVNLDGDVLGVINAGGGDNIGFAISGPLTLRVVPELIRDGDYAHSYMGVYLSNISPAIAAVNDLDTGQGVYIAGIVDGGPSDGVLRGRTDTETVYGQEVPVGGDVVVSLDGTPIPERRILSAFLALETTPGDTIDVGVIRDGQRQTVQLTLGRRPDS
jgi:S1-C subfamily serine protease